MHFHLGPQPLSCGSGETESKSPYLLPDLLNMSTKRITLNVAATYTQTFVSLVIGLFCSRWVYNALGETQFGLFAVVGSLIAFIAVLNHTLISSSGRFFAFALGQQSCPGADKDLLCKWFNTAVSVQVILPTALVVIGGPIGLYTILHLLTIPDGLRHSCVLIFGFSLIATFVQMMLSPVQALYYAKQFIFVRNIFGIVNTLLFAGEGWWLLHYDGNRLVAHAAATTGLMVLANVVLAAFAAWQVYPPKDKLKLGLDLAGGRLRRSSRNGCVSVAGGSGGGGGLAAESAADSGLVRWGRLDAIGRMDGMGSWGGGGWHAPDSGRRVQPSLDAALCRGTGLGWADDGVGLVCAVPLRMAGGRLGSRDLCESGGIHRQPQRHLPRAGYRLC